jgi:hypothetical protein
VPHFIYCYAERQFSECRYAECRYTEWPGADSLNLTGKTQW